MTHSRSYAIPMEVGEADQTVRRLCAELATERARAEVAARNAAGLTKIIAGYVEMFPELQSVVDGDVNLFLLGDDDERPRGAEAVRLILQERPNYWWWVTELVDEMRNRGWLPESENPANAVRTALERLIASSDSDVVKGRDSANKVIYSYRPDDPPPTGRPVPSEPAYDEEPF